jgi:hypothetical protein
MEEFKFIGLDVHKVLGPTLHESAPLTFDGSDRRTPRRAGA